MSKSLGKIFRIPLTQPISGICGIAIDVVCQKFFYDIQIETRACTYLATPNLIKIELANAEACDLVYGRLTRAGGS